MVIIAQIFVHNPDFKWTSVDHGPDVTWTGSHLEKQADAPLWLLIHEFAHWAVSKGTPHHEMVNWGWDEQDPTSAFLDELGRQEDRACALTIHIMDFFGIPWLEVAHELNMFANAPDSLNVVKDGTEYLRSILKQEIEQIGIDVPALLGI